LPRRLRRQERKRACGEHRRQRCERGRRPPPAAPRGAAEAYELARAVERAAGAVLAARVKVYTLERPEVGTRGKEWAEEQHGIKARLDLIRLRTIPLHFGATSRRTANWLGRAQPAWAAPKPWARPTLNIEVMPFVWFLQAALKAVGSYSRLKTGLPAAGRG
jgi:hypothetical protein